MSKTKKKATPTVADLYAQFVGVYRQLQEARFVLFTEAKEHFLKKEYNEAYDKFKELHDNLLTESLRPATGAKALKVSEEITDHLHHDLLGRLRFEKKKQHIRFVLNEIHHLDRCLYPATTANESQIHTGLNT